MQIQATVMIQSHQKFEMLNIAQVATILAVSTKTVRRLIERGQLHFHRIGGSVRVSPEDLRAYINAARH